MNNLKKSYYRVFFLAFVMIFLSVPALAQKLDMDKLKGMQARSIGPAGMSGRVTAIAVVHDDPSIIYIGTASGGLWKSTSGGIDWEPIFDDQPVASIGALAIDQNNPMVIWAGTGEGNPRNSQTSGDGIYKSIDGGKSWKMMGLKNSRNIHRVIINPQNPDIVYAAGIGTAWGENPERGVFRTKDGGKTWENLLYIDEKTGVAELVMDPENPNKLIAAMWEYRRWPWFFKSGGPGSGLYITFDGGDNWDQRTDKDGLPAGELGRMGLAIAKSNPKIIYALIESKKNALYKSEDGGFKWSKVTDRNVSNRPFYYGEIHVDPNNENRIYNLHSRVTVSHDGGKTFQSLMRGVHPDHHAWWIHPDDPSFLIDGNDGGMAISHDMGKSWRFVENLPLAQFYHINVDMETPYNVYGGMQDNGSWRGPSQVWRSGGIRNAYWEEVAFGDGFDVVPDQSDPRYGYAMSQGGNLRRYDLVTGSQKNIKPIHPDDMHLRFNWNAGIAHDPFDKTTIYYGSQFVHKSTDRGDNWEIISADLTTNDPEKQKQLDSGGLSYDVTQAENFTTIISIAPSPVQQGVIWVGTDDGNVQITQDGGETWTNTVGKVKGVPEGTWVPQIRPSTYNAGEAFVVFENHRRNDWNTYVYHTTNFGKSWKQFVKDEDVWGYALSIIQDPVEPNLIFLGTEFGLYITIDFAKNWTKWTNGFPTASTMDLAIHPREHDLVIGTFGRSAYVLDDIRPLRALAKEGAEIMDKRLHAFTPPDAIQAIYRQASGTRFAAEAEYAGENRDRGGMISFVYNPDPNAKKKKIEQREPATEQNQFRGGRFGGGGGPRLDRNKDKVKIEILNGDDEVIRTFQRNVEPGVNRIYWGLRRKGSRFPNQPKPTRANAREPGGAPVMPGSYTVRITDGKSNTSAMIAVKQDPRIEVSDRDLQERNALYDQFLAKVEVATEAMDRVREAKETTGMISKQIKERTDDVAKDLKKKGKAVGDSIKALIEFVLSKQDVQGIRRDPLVVASKIRTASSYLRAWHAVLGSTERMAIKHAEASMQVAVTKINGFFATSWKEYKDAVDAADLSFFKEYEPLKLDISIQH